MTAAESSMTQRSKIVDDALSVAKLAAQSADDKQGSETIVIPVGEILGITEYFVVTGASNRRLVRAVAEAIEERVREICGRSPGRTEGYRELQWVLLDYGDVVVHVFLDEIRQFYEIERLYIDVPRVEWHD